MLGYRSIGFDELMMLFMAKNPIYGRKLWASSQWTQVNNPPDYGVVCFFADDYKWHDKEHKFDIIVQLKNPILGHGIYMASKSLSKTHVWYGREGKTEYKIPELYVRYYTLSDIVSINTYGYFNKSVTEIFKKICKENNIKFIG